ncbi:MAG: IS3 family transposase [Proteobacteria bacterium]|nr:IS3 family transposase [Pseudomonadota bacterium]
MGGQRGRLIPIEQRTIAIKLIDEAVSDGAGIVKACEVLDISVRTYYRWRKNADGDKRRGAEKKIPRKLTLDEEQEIISVSCEKRLCDCTPYQIVAILLDEGRYIASTSSFYRVLKASDLLHHRKRGRSNKKKATPPELVATGPNQVFSWDITWLKTDVNGIFFFAYMIIDIWSRKLVGWEIHTKESADISSQMFKRLSRKLKLKGVKLHSDNGHPMRGSTMIQTLYNLGILPSFSRPRVSNDNPFSESFFKTVKYTAGFPSFFTDLEHARAWMADFVNWYNTEHRHSGIGLITPEQRHCGEGSIIMGKRNNVMSKAYSLKPERWSSKPAV